MLTLVSFGKGKHGDLDGADVVFNACTIQNPHRDRALRALTGCDPRVSSKVLKAGGLKLVFDVMRYVESHRNAKVGVFCYGGRHRSVAIVNEVARLLTARGLVVVVEHRDLNRH